MEVTGIICEYNPLHLGHAKQLGLLQGEDRGTVCLMSGNFVQRGTPAIVDKSLRAKAAVLCGADLVLELPAVYSLSSAEGFAAGGVGILSPFCQRLCFGAETPDKNALLHTAQALLSEGFSQRLRTELDKGLSFPAARQRALEAMGLEGSLLSSPNNILAVEYCKAILAQGASIEPMPIPRGGSYHAEDADPENPSATAIRSLMAAGEDYVNYIPAEARLCFENASVHTLAAGERAVLGKLRAMTEDDFAALPYGSEGLWRKLMHAAREKATLEELFTAVKSKRYTRTRLERMVMCAFLGLTENALQTPPPYVRVLAFNDKGRAILKKARDHGIFLNAGEAADHPFWETEQRMGDLYGLFAQGLPDAPGCEKRRRVFYRETP